MSMHALDSIPHSEIIELNTLNSLAAEDELSRREVCLPAVWRTSILAAITARIREVDVKTRGLVWAVIIHITL